MVTHTTIETFTDLSALPNTDTSSGPRTFHRYRKQLYEMYQKHTPIKQVYKETLRQLLAFFGSFSYINKEDQVIGVKAIPAHQERAIAKINEDKNLILPIISVGEASSDNDDNRRRNGSIIVPGTIWDDKKRRAIRTLSFPARPINITYEVGIWSTYLEPLNQIQEQIFAMFNPYIDVPTKYSTRTKGILESEENVSQVEAPDREDRVLKKIFHILVQTYVPSPVFKVTETGKIEVINTEMEII